MRAVAIVNVTGNISHFDGKNKIEKWSGLVGADYVGGGDVGSAPPPWCHSALGSPIQAAAHQLLCFEIVMRVVVQLNRESMTLNADMFMVFGW